MLTFVCFSEASASSAFILSHESIIFVFFLFINSEVLHLDNEASNSEDKESDKVSDSFHVSIWVLCDLLDVQVAWISWSILTDTPDHKV